MVPVPPALSGRVQFGEEEAAPAAQPDCSYCTLVRFEGYTNEKHQCGYCKGKSYFYCPKCFPDQNTAEYAICNPCASSSDKPPKPCFHMHISGVKPTHKMQHRAKNKQPAEPTRQSPRRPQAARTGPGADADVAGARRRL